MTAQIKLVKTRKTNKKLHFTGFLVACSLTAGLSSLHISVVLKSFCIKIDFF